MNQNWLGQLIDVIHHTALNVSCLILVNNVLFSKLIQHLLHFRQKFYGSCFVSCSAELTNRITHCLGVISVVQSARRRLTNSFYR